MSQAPTTLTEISAQLAGFASTMGVKEEDIYVRLMLAAGNPMTFRGLKINAVVGGKGGWAEIRGADLSVGEALFIRESHVLWATFHVEAAAPEPFGFKPSPAP